MSPRIVHGEAIRAAVTLDLEVVAAAERAFVLLASASVIMPPVHQILVDDHHGQTCIKSAYTKGDSIFVAKAASTFHDNAARGLSNTSGLMLVFDAATGVVDTILLDDGYLTALRTAAAGAVAAKWLAREHSTRVAILGAGKQARLQLEAVRLVRPVEHVRVWSPRPDRAQAFAAEQDGGRLRVEAAATVERAVEGADLIVCTTPARAPILRAEWVEPGAHITAMGSDAPGKSELDPALVAAARPYVCDSRSQCRTLGEWRAAIDAGAVGDDFEPPELGEIIVGSRHLERSANDVTICDLTGLGVQDAEIARFARDRLCGSI